MAGIVCEEGILLLFFSSEHSRSFSKRVFKYKFEDNSYYDQQVFSIVKYLNWCGTFVNV